MPLDSRKFSLSKLDSDNSDDFNGNGDSGDSGQGEDGEWSKGSSGQGRGREGASQSPSSSAAPTTQPQPLTTAVAETPFPALPAGWIRLDDTSPYITYSSGQWITDHPEDGATPKYLNSTFHSSTTSSAWMHFAWRGSDIIVYGAKRGNHGLYAVALDDYPVLYLSGLATNPEIFQQPLFQSQNLTKGLHSLLLVNENAYNATSGSAAGQIFLDIDFIDFDGEALDSVTYAKQKQQIESTPRSSSYGIPPTTISITPKASAASMTNLAKTVSHGPAEALVTITSSLSPGNDIPNSRPSGAATFSADRVDAAGLLLIFWLYIPLLWLMRR